jgi:polar amino acid transport system substrate-binding protein
MKLQLQTHNGRQSTLRVAKLLTVLGMAGASLVACGGASASPPAKKSTQLPQLLKQVASSHKLIIGTSNDAPWSYITSSGQAEGVIPAILRDFLAAEHIKATIDSIAMPFGSLIPSIQSGRIEMVGDAMYDTSVRAQVISFTRIMFWNPPSLVTGKGNPLHITALAGFCGHSVGSYEGTTYVDSLNAAAKTCPSGKKMSVVVLPTVQDVIADIASGRLTGGLFDSSIASYALHVNPSLKMTIVSSWVAADKASDKNALGVAKNNASVLPLFNKVFAKLLQNGTIAKIFTANGLKPANTWLTLKG